MTIWTGSSRRRTRLSRGGLCQPGPVPKPAQCAVRCCCWGPHHFKKLPILAEVLLDGLCRQEAGGENVGWAGDTHPSVHCEVTVALPSVVVQDSPPRNSLLLALRHQQTAGAEAVRSARTRKMIGGARPSRPAWAHPSPLQAPHSPSGRGCGMFGLILPARLLHQALAPPQALRSNRQAPRLEASDGDAVVTLSCDQCAPAAQAAPLVDGLFLRCCCSGCL